MEYFSHQGCKVAYVQHGTGTPLVFLHNGGTSHVIWQPLLERLSTEYRMWALDLPGFGASEMPPSWSLDTFTDMLAAFVYEQVGDTPVGLVGNCMGSAIALAYARRFPQRVQALVLNNPLTAETFSEGHFRLLSELQRHQPRFTGMLTRGVSRVSLPSALVNTALKMQLGKRGRMLKVWRNKELQNCYRRHEQMSSLTELFQSLPQYAALDKAPAVEDQIPMITLWGKQNLVLSAYAGSQLNQTLKPDQALILEDCGHLLMLERPEVVCNVIQQIVRTQ